MAAATQTTSERLLTFEDVAKLDPETHAGELVQGIWIPVTKSPWRHGEVVVRIALLLGIWARNKSDVWSVSAGDPGTRLARDPDVLRGPDVAVVARERVPTGTGAQGWLDGAPDFAVEVLGDSQTVGELFEKALEYLSAGAKLVWIVDSTSERVLVVTPPDHVAVVGPAGELDGGDTLPGFRCAVADIFAR